MEPPTVHLIHLEPMHVATAYGFGENPEETAWQALVAWAATKCLLDDLEAHPIFGLNNPYPRPGSTKYGYEFWVKVDSETEPEGCIRIEEFFGGFYAVAQCEVKGHPENIPGAWQKLVAWCKENHHQLGHHPALERFLSSPGDIENLVMELYCPIEQ